MEEEHKHLMSVKWENDKVWHKECECGLAFDEPKPLPQAYYPQQQIKYQQPKYRPAGKPFDARYMCHNCGKEFKMKFQFGIETPDSEVCPKCGVSKSLKLTWK